MMERVETVFSQAHGLVSRKEADIRHGLSATIDRQFLDMAHRVGSVAGNELFTVVDEAYLESDPRPDAVNHHMTVLPPNVMSSAEQANVLTLLEIMHGEQVTELTEKFSDFASEYDIFERVQKGAKFILASNHLQLPDQGFTLGYTHRAGREKGFDRIENISTVVVGRLLGYFKLGEASVIDDVLRKAGSILKSFPVSGGEAINEAQAKSEMSHHLRAFRRFYNGKTNQAYRHRMAGPGGHILFQALGGAQEVPKDGIVHMNPLSDGSSDLLVEASAHNAEIVPLFVDYNFDHSLVEFGQPRKVADRDQAHEVGLEIAKMGNASRSTARLTQPDIERFKDTIIYEVA